MLTALFITGKPGEKNSILLFHCIRLPYLSAPIRSYFLGGTCIHHMDCLYIIPILINPIEGLLYVTQFLTLHSVFKISFRD